MRPSPLFLSRRQVLVGTGALVVSFSAARNLAAQEGNAPPAAAGPKLPGSLKKSPYLDSWIRVAADGEVTVLTGKVELGQGIKTALLQIAAEELDVPLASLKLVTADTEDTANEEYTSGSRSMQDSGTAIRNAAAQAREILMGEAAKRWGLPADRLKASGGAVLASDGRRVTFAELVSSDILHMQAAPISRFKDPSQFKTVGTSAKRIDIPAKVTGGLAYVQDMRLPGMLHARVVRPPSYAAKLTNIDFGAIEKAPGVVKVIRDGNFLAVVAEKEFEAIKAMRELADAARWEEAKTLPDAGSLPAMLKRLRSDDTIILDRNTQPAASARKIEARYTKPYLLHGSIGPSCAVAKFDRGKMTIWTHTQGVYPDRKAIAELLHLPEAQVHCIHAEGSGCYGHNGADDAAADAALIARAVAPRPVRLQWMREQENCWEPFGPAMLVELKGGVDEAGKIVEWQHEVWSNTHSTRPGTAGSLLAGRHVAGAFPEPAPRAIPQPEGGGDRNSIPLYKFPNARVVHHFLPEMPIRVSAHRSLGAYMNVFAIESFMNELAALAGADPVAFRLAHLDDKRAKDVIEMTAANFGWQPGVKRQRGQGFGFAFAQYKNLAAYCAIAMEVDVAPENGRVRIKRAVSAVDAGLAVNPDGIKNQIEGGILQSASWTLFEAAGFDDTRITSIDWAAYPILRFDSVPEAVEVHVITRPDKPFLGAGEAAQGPAAAALANAIADATGRRFRDLPLSQDRVAEKA